MSWTLGYISFTGTPVPRNLPEIHSSSAHRFESDSRYIACAEHSRTCAYGGRSSEGWLVCGLGLELDEAGVRIWEPTADLPPAGHFVSVRWTADEVVIRTDPLGLRTIFLCELDGGLLLSTRLDWIARASGRSMLDLEALGSRFLAFSQLSYESGIEGITRLGPGGLVRYSANGLELDDRPWAESDSGEDAASELTSALGNFARPRTDQFPAGVRLGLSGGIDSRLLLALNADQPNLSAYVFGFADEPDVVSARALADAEGFECTWYDTTLPGPEECVEILKEYVSVTSGFSFATDLIEKRHYPTIAGEGALLLFGLGGELIRRQFLNRFLLTGGSRALLRGERDAVRDLLISASPALIRREALDSMYAGASQRLDAAFDAMPDPRSFGTQNWADLFMVRYRVANPHMAHQTLLDHLGYGFSPFEQVAVLDPLFRIPVRDRRNSRLSKRIIRDRRSSLTDHPLVMNDMTYPFEMSTGMAVAWTRFRTRNQPSFLSRARIELLRHLEEFVLDLAASQSLDDDPVHDSSRVRERVAAFYDGEEKAAESVERWLTFALWKAGMG